eukprot:270330-Chlamydomonas_euryale.AAC.2
MSHTCRVDLSPLRHAGCPVLRAHRCRACAMRRMSLRSAHRATGCHRSLPYANRATAPTAAAAAWRSSAQRRLRCGSSVAARLLQPSCCGPAAAARLPQCSCQGVAFMQTGYLGARDCGVWVQGSKYPSFFSLRDTAVAMRLVLLLAAAVCT